MTARTLLCAACERGDFAECSGWCGLVPPTWVGPVQPEVWDELREIVGDFDPWAESEGAAS